MLDRMRAHQQYHHQLQHQNQALPRPPALPTLGFMGGGYGLTDGRTDADTLQHPVRGSTLW